MTVPVSEAINRLIEVGAISSDEASLGWGSSTYHWKVAVLFSKTWKVIILKSFQNIMQVINLEIREIILCICLIII